MHSKWSYSRDRNVIFNQVMVYTGTFCCRFGLFNKTSSKYIPSGLIHVKETSFLTKRKVVKDN